MRAWRVEQHGDPRAALRLVDTSAPRPGAGEVRLRVLAAAVGLPDVLMCRGSYALTPPLPFTPGQEVVGVVEELGEGVALPVGARVMGVTKFTDGVGGFADQTLMSGALAFRVPDAMGDDQAAGFRIGWSTAWIALARRAEIAPGDQLVVLGAAGGSGAAAVQVGCALGAKVLAVVGGPEKADFCRALGADVVIDRSAEDVHDAVRDATGGHGADVVFDPVGGDAGEQALRFMASEGRFLAVGFASGSWPAIDVRRAVTGNFSVLGVYAGAYRRADNEHDHEQLLGLVDRGVLASVVTRSVEFDDLPAALDDVARGTAIGKTVVRVSGER